MHDVLIVGAGFAGAVMAERLQAHGLTPIVIDEREHVAGTAHDGPNEHGVQVQWFGPHAFHTQSPTVAKYLTQFTDWRPYEHRVVTRVGDVLAPMPVSRATVNAIYGMKLSSESEMAAFLELVRDKSERRETSEDHVIGQIGHDLYDKLFRDYTRKQWGRDASQLHASVCGRLPVRLNDDVRYFDDWFQAQPADGFTKLIERMLEGIEVVTGLTYRDSDIRHRHLVWSGQPDDLFGYVHGELPWRSMNFVHESFRSRELVQPCACVNETDPLVPWTRTTEHRWMTGQEHDWTTITKEISGETGDPHYPIPTKESWRIAGLYAEMAREHAETVTMVGRLGRYKYMTMDQVVGQALRTARELAERLGAAVH